MKAIDALPSSERKPREMLADLHSEYRLRTEPIVKALAAIEATKPLAFHLFALDLREQYMRQFTELPKHGTPAAELTDRDKLALALAAGIPTEWIEEGGKLTLRSTVPFGVTDRGDGGYIVASRNETS